MYVAGFDQFGHLQLITPGVHSGRDLWSSWLIRWGVSSRTSLGDGPLEC